MLIGRKKMTVRVEDAEKPDGVADAGAILLGGLLGALAGVIAGLWFAPRSGVETRDDIRERGLELRVQAETTAAEARARIEGPQTSDLIAKAKADATQYKSGLN